MGSQAALSLEKRACEVTVRPVGTVLFPQHRSVTRYRPKISGSQQGPPVATHQVKQQGRWPGGSLRLRKSRSRSCCGGERGASAVPAGEVGVEGETGTRPGPRKPERRPPQPGPPPPPREEEELGEQAAFPAGLVRMAALSEGGAFSGG